ncbi:MAG: low specificity L-threonine aldolase [Planctomycetaceae bacterium]|nr:low specificity L-threonine aldolase [Planctomycetaceae bacterium]MBP60778.1 low specificity L-threonine aldolase [Planctomycetaceae bacterium]
MIDLRSDTVTKPTPEMLNAITHAKLGDDVMRDDPTVLRLEEVTAEILGKEAAIYMPSGSMTNQIAVRLHCQPGAEFICETTCHVYNMEQGAFSQLSGVVARPIEAEQGVWRLEQLQSLIRPCDDHQVRTRLLTMENTHNRAGGRVVPYDRVAEICAWAHDSGLVTHLDGARLFNAVVATGIAADQWASHFDTVSVCFSKGLGAPVGSALAGPATLIREAQRHRKLFGGSMRQAGIIAAGALHALENHIDRLAEDHRHARILGEAVNRCEGLSLPGESVDTNIVIFTVDEQLGTAQQVVQRLAEQGVAVLAVAPQLIRAVTHLGITEQDVRQVARAIQEIGSQIAGA